jgi:hypothetical protein
VTFRYDTREDRVLAAINVGKPEAWSGWLTRRLALELLNRTENLVVRTSDLAQRAPANIRGELVAFERDAAMDKTAQSMSQTPGVVLKASKTTAELVDRVTIGKQGNNFRVELHGEQGGGAAAALLRVDLQRILQMLQVEIGKSGWLTTPAKPAAAPAAEETRPKPARH